VTRTAKATTTWSGVKATRRETAWQEQLRARVRLRCLDAGWEPPPSRQSWAPRLYPKNPSPAGAQARQRSSSAGLARALGTFEEWEGAQQRQAKGGQREAAAGEVRQEVRQKPLADLESEQEVSKQAFSAAGLQTLKPHANP
jgi:predicted transcriptional regulator